jgi:mono/diheme cytochrome c family protein
MTKKYIGFALLLCLFAMSTIASADDDDAPSKATAKNALYEEECGSCHMAYPPGFLPARSWGKIMANLQDHFGENAELSESAVADLTNYLTENASDRVNIRFYSKFSSSIRGGETPLRITDVPYFKKEHREIPLRLTRDNPEVLSLSQCQKCHTRAASGSFGEGEIKIPGYGRWDD